MTTPVEVEAVAEAWGRWRSEVSFPYDDTHCINGAKVALGALGALGVTASPVSVGFMLFNQFGWDMYCRQIPAAQWPRHAYSLGVTREATDHRPRDGAWYGHLMIEGEDWLLDVSAGQFHRPGLIKSPGPLVLPDVVIPPDDDEVIVVTDTETHQVMVLERWAANDAWQRASGWTRDQSVEVEMLLRRTHAVLDEMPRPEA